ncbi:acyl-CoA dehydrogenase [Arenicella chitinivorans]|uniref:Acyl-CoA dehydrogenase n=1 Tax=Arenicella chitinivorans TaxID=1329800 RepID=A0A918S1Y7_9GAMM|nr:acyl-CoA dehydrogenase family protein [Arenicella chitinivorans]GHA19831.1 acyl-CoA dehydrogenase [Arenicella chitinivorans]
MDMLNEFRDMVQRFLQAEVEPNIEQWEADKLMPKSFWPVMGGAGLLLVDFEAEHGGAEADFDVSLMVQEEMCRMGYHALASAYNIHANIVAPYILNIGTDAQKQHWLPGMASGEIVTALGMTEPSAGSDLAALRTRAVRDGDDYIINGSKVFITNGIHADMVVVAAKTDPEKGAKGVSLFLVDASLPGFEKGKKIEKMGQHSGDTAELFFSDVRVPADALLGKEGHGFAYMMSELPRERLGVAVQAIGHVQGALDMTVEYVKERQAFGQSVAKFQNTRFKLADVKTELELCRALMEKCLAKFKRDEMTVEDAAMLKYAATDMQVRVISECLQLFGGYGYTDEYPISRFYRDARVQTIYAGSTEIMKEIVARSILGR